MWEIGLPLQFAASLPEDLTDAELVEACRCGNLRAFERLYELHSARMKSLAFISWAAGRTRKTQCRSVHQGLSSASRLRRALLAGNLDLSDPAELLLRCDPQTAAPGGGSAHNAR